MNQPDLSQWLSMVSASHEHWVRRARLQLSFARDLCRLHPELEGQWRPHIEQAQSVMNAGLAAGKLDRLDALVADMERVLAPLSKTAKSYTVHCVGHAHIDMNWLWSWQETVSVTVDSFTTVLRLMEQYEAFTFSQSQASTYQILERHRPDLLRQIAERVKQGRWEVLASHWVEADKNMAGGEALCRHLLYTRAYMKELFGLRPHDVPVDWAPDTFGHPATMPMYLTRGGVRYVYLHRPGVHGPAKPGAFWWEGPDGSRVLARNDIHAGYNGQIGPAVTRELVRLVKLTGGRDGMFVYGVGDHGGGPTKRDIELALEMDTWPVFPRMRFSTAKKFFERLEKQSDKLPVIRGELNTEFTGCYTSQSLIKKANRLSENRLVDAEFAAVLAMKLDGKPYPAERLLEAWRHTLFSHFHDILPGSGVHDTRTYTHGLFQEIMAITGTIESHALRRVAALVDTRFPEVSPLPVAPASNIHNSIGAGVGFGLNDTGLPFSDQSAGDGPRPFVVFNPTPRDRREVIEATIWDSGARNSAMWDKKRFVAHGPDGTVIPTQPIKSGRYWGHEYLTLSFPVSVPGFGYARYTIVESLNTEDPVETVTHQLGYAHALNYVPVEHGIEGLENDRLRLELDPVTGGIRLLKDKMTGLELIRAPRLTPVLEYAVERAHPFSAWSVDHTGPTELPELTALHRDKTQGHRAGIELEMKVKSSAMRVRYELRSGDPRLHIRITGLWLERGTAQTGVPVLRLVVPLALTGCRARYESPFGAIDRDMNTGEELPALRWMRVSGMAGDQPAGVLLVNEGKHGHSLDGNTLRLTLIRSSYEPDPLPEMGEHDIRLALCPFTGECSVSDAIVLGQAFNHPLRVVGTDTHEGRLKPSGQFLKVEPEGVVVSSIKKSESSNALVVRLMNPGDKEFTAKVSFTKPMAGQVTGAQELDLMERPLPKGSAAVSGNGVRVKMPARALATVLVKLK